MAKASSASLWLLVALASEASEAVTSEANRGEEGTRGIPVLEAAEVATSGLVASEAGSSITILGGIT